MEPQEVGWESPVSGGFVRIEAVTEQRWESAMPGADVPPYTSFPPFFFHFNAFHSFFFFPQKFFCLYSESLDTQVSLAHIVSF